MTTEGTRQEEGPWTGLCCLFCLFCFVGVLLVFVSLFTFGLHFAVRQEAPWCNAHILANREYISQRPLFMPPCEAVLRPPACGTTNADVEGTRTLLLMAEQGVPVH